ncbi:MAG: histidine kinase N-terminal 7TM domain-containing protein [Tenuifilaceae bacterium]|nr:histidine kinase N-terminal 7TM domain-containing protein [Tenuifilaceae bacterium]
MGIIGMVENVFVILLLLSAVLSTVLAVYVQFRRKSLDAPSLAWLLIAVAVWCFASAVDMQLQANEHRAIFNLIRYLGIVSTPVFFLYFALEYSRMFNQFKRFLSWPVWIIPVLSIIFLATNNYHNLFYTYTYDSAGEVIVNYRAGHGVWWWVYIMYSYTIILIAFGFFIRMLIQSIKDQRSNIWLILISSTLPFVLNIFYAAGFRFFAQGDPTPIVFAFSCSLFFWGLYSKKLFQIKPIALNVLFSSMPDGIVVTDINTVVIDINPAALSILGIEGEKPISRKVQSILPYHFDFLNGKALNKLHLLKIRDRNIEAIHAPISNEQHRITGYFIIFKDVTARYQSEVNLRLATQRLELVSEAAGLDPWENNLITGERFGGMEVYRNLGYLPSETPKTIEEIFELVHPDDLEHVKQSLQDHFDGKTRVYTCDFRVRDKSNGYQWFANYGRIVERDGNGNPVRFIGITQNINERKQVEERIRRKNDDLIKANAEKDKFFSIIAHDLKGPFQGFIGLTELMSGGMGNIDEQTMQEIASSINVSAKNLYELLDNLLNWSMIQRGYKRFNPQKVLLSSVVDEVDDIFAPQIASKSIFYKSSIDSTTSVLADRESLKTILRNLLSNALKFTLHHGTITLSSQLVGKGFTQVTVSDSGIGMPDSIKSNLFSISTKVSRPGTDKEPSTGLGLILCKELVEKHGGKIWVDSQEDKGSSFHFTIPTSS